MDDSRAELTRIIGYPNPHGWCIQREEEQEEEVSLHRYYFVDQDGTNAYGDTSLHRLMALHASPSVVANFLWHAQEHDRRCNSNTKEEALGPYEGLLPPPTLLDTNHQGITALHVAIFRNSWHVSELVQLLLQRQPQLATLPMTNSQMYPLHICTGHSLTISQSLLEQLLRAAPEVALCHDAQGNNPLALLWKNVRRFRWAQQCEQQQGRVPHLGVPCHHESNNNNNNHPNDDPHTRKRDLSWMTVIAPHQYLDYSLAIVEAGLWESQRSGFQKKLTWHDICGFPQCPPLLIRVLVALQHQTEEDGVEFRRSCPVAWPDTNALGQSALHCAAQAEPIHMESPVATPLVQLLLQMDPGAASRPDHHGTLVLHEACRTQSVATLARLVAAAPQALYHADPTTGLYPAQLLATRDDLFGVGPDKELLGVTSMGDTLLYQTMRSCPEIVQY